MGGDASLGCETPMQHGLHGAEFRQRLQGIRTMEDELADDLVSLLKNLDTAVLFCYGYRSALH